MFGLRKLFRSDVYALSMRNPTKPVTGMDTHLRHEEQHLKSSDLLTDIVIGMSDGLTVPFALAAGLSGAVSSTGIIVIAGIAEICAGSIAMGLGGYLAGKTEQDHYKTELQREFYEVDNLPDREVAETKEFFANIGLGIEHWYLLHSWGTCSTQPLFFCDTTSEWAKNFRDCNASLSFYFWLVEK